MVASLNPKDSEQWTHQGTIVHVKLNTYMTVMLEQNNTAISEPFPW